MKICRQKNKNMQNLLKKNKNLWRDDPTIATAPRGTNPKFVYKFKFLFLDQKPNLIDQNTSLLYCFRFITPMDGINQGFGYSLSKIG